MLHATIKSSILFNIFVHTQLDILMKVFTGWNYLTHSSLKKATKMTNCHEHNNVQLAVSENRDLLCCDKHFKKRIIIKKFVKSCKHGAHTFLMSGCRCYMLAGLNAHLAHGWCAVLFDVDDVKSELSFGPPTKQTIQFAHKQFVPWQFINSGFCMHTCINRQPHLDFSQGHACMHFYISSFLKLLWFLFLSIFSCSFLLSKIIFTVISGLVNES